MTGDKPTGSLLARTRKAWLGLIAGWLATALAASLTVLQRPWETWSLSDTQDLVLLFVPALFQAVATYYVRNAGELDVS